MCLLNARSLGNKLPLLHSFVYSSTFSVFCFTETWLSSNFFDNEIIPTGFCLFRKDRPSRGGGVLVAVKDTLSNMEISSPSDLEVALYF